MYRDGVHPFDALRQLGLKVLKSPIYLEFILLHYIFRSAKIKKLEKSSKISEINKKILLNILERLKKKITKIRTFHIVILDQLYKK